MKNILKYKRILKYRKSLENELKNEIYILREKLIIKNGELDIFVNKEKQIMQEILKEQGFNLNLINTKNKYDYLTALNLQILKIKNEISEINSQIKVINELLKGKTKDVKILEKLIEKIKFMKKYKEDYKEQKLIDEFNIFKYAINSTFSGE